ncbi:MAG: tetraacyldisaccharide 4'-kinase [Arenimonas sp.]
MRAKLEAALNRRWYGGVKPNPGLLAIAFLYYKLNQLRRFLYRKGILKSSKISVPVIVVGNFTAGGTGKTPFTIALVQAMQKRGWNPGVVSRGYGRESTDPVSVHAGSSAQQCGDEPLLIHQRTKVAIRVDSNRVAAAEFLIQNGCNLIIADDGLQHIRLQRDLEIELIDHERKYGNGMILPAGPLREYPRPCDFKVANGSLEDDVVSHDYGMQLIYSDAERLDASVQKNLKEFSGSKVNAIAGIGHPERFFNALMARGLNVNAIAFPDHHTYSTDDFPVDAPILMTEKDAVKCRQLGLKDAWCIPVNAVLNETLFDTIDKKLKALSR